jgi:hypothetical protein
MSAPFAAFSYTPKTPKGYACTDCGATGVKLWREYNTVLDRQSLRCCDCAAKNQGRHPIEIDDDGKNKDIDTGLRCDQIGWLVPAVPTEDGTTMWGYSSVPRGGVMWWKALPNRVGKVAKAGKGTDGPPAPRCLLCRAGGPLWNTIGGRVCAACMVKPVRCDR